MKKVIFFLSILLLCKLPITKHAFANDKNIFGLHLTQTSDIIKAWNIINSSGGDWGWATIVIRPDQLNHQTWQEFFDICRQRHIIPIIRIATIVDNGSWKVPSEADVDTMVSFLNSLNWPTQEQHVILYNEINHATEWGGEVNIDSYVKIASYAADKFKSANSNFTILPSALDLAAPSKMPNFESAANTYKQILQIDPNFFTKFDGLASHSYPNHGFVGSPHDIGQHSIRGYHWELNQIGKNIPVYITETGWPHYEGYPNDKRYYRAKTTANFLTEAIRIWQQDKDVIAVTPFIYNYPNQPFDHFSWLDKEENLYPEYRAVVDLNKSKNSPNQTTSYQQTKLKLPILMFTDNDYTGTLTLKNTGQSIWGEKQFCLTPTSSKDIIIDAICLDNTQVYPQQSHDFIFKFKITANADHQRSYLGFADLETTEITPIISAGSIYRPKTGLLQKIKNILRI